MEQLRVFSCPFKDFSVKTRKLWSFLKYCQVCLWFWVNIYLWNLEQSARPFLQISYLYQMIVSVINDAMFRNIYFLATKLWYLFYWTKVGLWRQKFHRRNSVTLFHGGKNCSVYQMNFVITYRSVTGTCCLAVSCYFLSFSQDGYIQKIIPRIQIILDGILQIIFKRIHVWIWY